MKENSDIDGGGKLDSTRSSGRNQGAYGNVKRGGTRSRARREQKERSDNIDSQNSNNNTATQSLQPSKLLPQATAEQIRIAQLLSNVDEETILKQKVNQVVELTDCDQDTAALSLHDCDGDINLAVHMILDSRANAACSNGFDDGQKQDEWQTTSKRHPKKSINTTDSTNGQNHDGSSTDRGDDWGPKSKELSRDRRNTRRGASERRGGSRPRPGSGVNENSDDVDKRRNRSERRGRGNGRGRNDRGNRQRPNDSISPGGAKDENNFFVNGSTDNDFGSFQNESHGSSRDRGMPPRFDARRGGRGNMRGGGGGRVFSSRGGRGSRGRSRLSYGHYREKVPSGAGDGNSMNWNDEPTEKPSKLQDDDGWDDVNDWDSPIWRGETKIYINSKVAKHPEESPKVDDSQSISDDKNEKLLSATSVEEDDPAIVNSVSSAQLSEAAAVAAYNLHATEVIKTSLGIGASAGVGTVEAPKPQRQPRQNDKANAPASNLSTLDKNALRAALEEEILCVNGPKHAESKAPPPCKKPDKPVELPRMRGLPVDTTASGLSFGFGLLDELKISPVKSDDNDVDSNVDSTQPHVPIESDQLNQSTASDLSARQDSTIQEYLSSSLNSSFQCSERQPTPATNTVSPVKPPSITTPSQYHSPLKGVDSEDVSSTDPFQNQTTSISAELAAELSNKLATRTDNEQSSQTVTQESSHPELQSSRNDVPTVPAVMDKATQPTPSSSQQNTPNKATGISRSQQTNVPLTVGGTNLLSNLPSAAVSALLNYSHLTTTGHPSFPSFINIPTMPQGNIDYEQIVQQQQRIIYDLALQQQQQQHTPQQPNQNPSSQQTQHHNQSVHQHESTTSIATAGSSGSTVINVSGSNSVSGNGLKTMPSSMRATSVGDVPVQSPTTATLPGSALPHLQTVASSVVSTASGVGTTTTHPSMFMPPGYAPYYTNYYAANPAAAAAAAAQVGAPPPGHHPNAGTTPYNPATFLSLMNSINQPPVNQALSSPPHFGSSMGVNKGQSNNVFSSYPDRNYAGNSGSGFEEHIQDMKYSNLNAGKDLSNAYGSSSSGSAKPSSLSVGPASSAYHSGVSSGSAHRGNSSISESNTGSRSSGNTGLDSGSKSMTGTGGVAPGAGASGFPYTLTNPGLYNASYVPFMPPHHPHHHITQAQQERQGTSSGVPQGAAAGSLPGGPQFGSKGNSSVFSKQATAILHQNYHPSGTSTNYWNSLK